MPSSAYPFILECRVPGSDVQQCVLEPVVAEPGQASLRVGRATQSTALWEHLLPHEATRNTVSRDQFEIRQVGAGFVLANLSRCGSVVNGGLVSGEAVPLRHGDVVAVGADLSAAGLLPGSCGTSRPAALLRFATSDAGASAPSEPRRLPAWRLRCLGVSGRSLKELALLDEDARNLEATQETGATANVLRVGRALQPTGFWERLVPDDGTRVLISREHFQIRALWRAGPYEPCLENCSVNGTLLNGALVTDQLAPIRDGDVLAVPGANGQLEQDSYPVVVKFRFEAVPGCAGEKGPVAAAGALGGPAFALQCLTPASGGCAATAEELERLAVSLREAFSPGHGARALQVGRAVQDMSLWAALLPDEAVRNTISRSHFEVFCCDDGGGGGAARGWKLLNLSSLGTLVNGVRVHGQAPLRLGDVVGIGTAELRACRGGGGPVGGEEEDPPAVELRLVQPGSPLDGAPGGGGRGAGGPPAAAAAVPKPGGRNPPEDACPRTLGDGMEDSAMDVEEEGEPSALGQLRTLEARLMALEGEVNAVERSVQATATAGCRDALAQLEAQLSQLQCRGIDSVSTLQLDSASREAARELKRRLTHRAEALHDRVDSLFEALRR